MHIGASKVPPIPLETGPFHTGYVWGIAAVAALGGLLFGYDWVVIGGAKTFYQIYFHLHSARLVGWANSCALVGCLLGSMVAGALSDRFGRKKILLLSAALFACSSLFTGWSNSFLSFISWRIVGGIAIGLASNVSPTYIAEISPAPWRGRLVSLNQLSIVTGILAAQIVNWLIAKPVPVTASALEIAHSWNVLFGWRWMFTAVSIPAAIFFFAALVIPESPRWLLGKSDLAGARHTLMRIGGDRYATSEIEHIQAVIRTELASSSEWSTLMLPGIQRILLIGCALAVLQQWCGINILFNYAEDIYRAAGYGVSQVFFNIVITGAINLFFTFVAMGFVDRFGRRTLMIAGCAGVGISHLLAAIAYWRGMQGLPVLILTLCAIACYSASLAPVTWVLISEIFPNRVRGVAVSVAVSALWASSFVLTYTFPFLNRRVGTAGTFLGYAAVCFLGEIFILAFVPETKGKSLEEIERSLADAASAER